ncbi:MAG: xanthine dehydrogenase family protein molybdopterin-binding subunit [Pseudolabrys sp.]
MNAPFRRKEDNRLVRGRGRFVDDEGGRALHVRLVRSPYAHARIRSVDVSEAEASEGVICTLTGAEVATLTNRFMQIAPAPADQVVDYCMAPDRVRFQGEPVAAVVATSVALAVDAAEKVRVDYEPLPVVVDAVEALRNETLLHEQVGTNESWGSLFEWGEVDKAFAQADTVVAIDRLKFHRFSSTPLETYGGVVTWEASGRIDMLCNLIQPGVAMKFMAPALGVSPEELRVRTQDIGGGFGIKQNLYPYLMIAALASRKAGNRPIKWIEDRREHLQGSAHGNERTFLDIKVALKADGEITAVSAIHVDDCGAYPRYEPLGGVIWSQVAPASYRLRNLRINFRQAMTNKCPVGPNRGFSRMQNVWFLERVVDICAHEMGIAPDVMRQRNYIPEMPWTTPNGCVYDSGDYAAMLAMAKDMIGWDDWVARRDAMRVEGRLVGIGIGTALDSGTNNFGQSTIVNPKSGLSGNSEAANVRVGVDGSLTVIVGSVPQGQSHETVAAQLVAKELGVPEDIVRVASGFDSERATHTSHSGTYASQFAVTSVGAIHGAVEKVRGELLTVAAMLLQKQRHELRTGVFGGVAGVGTVDGSSHVSFSDISNLINTKTAGLPAELEDISLNCRYVYRAPFQLPDPVRKYGNLTLTYAAQVHVGVIEIDPLTHNIHVLDYAAVDDCGRVMNHTIVKGQVIGAAAHGFGAALMENLRYDANGNLLTATFSDYCPITMLNMPNIRYGNRESPSPFTYNGAKGMGEGGGGPIFALSSALQDALAASGTRLNQSHYSPSDLHAVMTGTQPRGVAQVSVTRQRPV